MVAGGINDLARIAPKLYNFNTTTGGGGGSVKRELIESSTLEMGSAGDH